MTSTPATSLGELDSPADVLGSRVRHAAANHAEADLLTAAVTWAEQHPPESIGEEATWITPAGDTGIPIAGEGAPLVAEFCIAEFALAVGRSTDAGGAASRSRRAQVPAARGWGPGAVAATWRHGGPGGSPRPPSGLSREAAAFVDAQVAPFAHRIGIAALERLVAEAIARYMPDRAAEDAARGCRRTALHDRAPAGLLQRHQPDQGELDLADALDLDAAVSQGPGSWRSLGRPSPSTYAAPWPPADRPPPARPRPHRGATAVEQRAASAARPQPGRRPKPRQVVLYVHLSEAAITGTRTASSWPGWRTSANVVTADQVRPGAPTRTPR